MKALFGWMDCRLEDGRVKKWRFYVLSGFLLSNLGFYESCHLGLPGNWRSLPCLWGLVISFRNVWFLGNPMCSDVNRCFFIEDVSFCPGRGGGGKG